MRTPLSRRELLRRGALVPAAAYLGARVATAEAAGAAAQLAHLERRYDVRLGVSGFDTGRRRHFGWRADERFPFCSTYKALAAGLVLHRRTIDELDSVILRYDKADLVDYSPVTSKHLDTGMSIRDVCAAAVRYSDNTAGNLLFRELGGPAGFTRALREMGDRVTSSVRTETALNTAIPGERRDTSTPRALAADLRRLALGSVLDDLKRQRLHGWLLGNTTGENQIRAGVPKDWAVGDKTGLGERGSRNDIAVLWPPHRKPIVLSVLSTRGTEGADTPEVLIAAATRVAVAVLR